MAIWLVLQKFDGILGTRHTRYIPGQLVDDLVDPVTAALAAGAAMIQYDAIMAPAVALYNAQHGVKDPDQTMMAVLSANGITPSTTGGLAGELYVDGEATETPMTGTRSNPYSTIAAALAVAAAGDTIKIASGTYTEDVALVDDVHLRGLSGPLGASPTIIGTVTGDDTTCTLEDLSLLDDGAGNALHVTGVAANVITILGCLVTGTATGDPALEIDNTNAAAGVIANNSRIVMTTGNAAEALLIESGILTAFDCQIAHADVTSEAVVAEGDAATVVNLLNCSLVGQLVSEAAAANPTIQITDTLIEVTTVSAITIAAGNTVTAYNSRLTSTDAGDDAVDGAGNLVVGGSLVFLGTADQVAAAVTLSHLADSKVQLGTYTEAAEAGARAIAFDHAFPSAVIVVTLGFEDTGDGVTTASIATGTLATTGFTLNTGGNGIFHWRAEVL